MNNYASEGRKPRFAEAFAGKDALKGKTVFWDIDGTLTAFRFDGSMRCPSMKGEKGLSDIACGMYLEKRPSAHMQRVVRECGAKEQLILGRYFTEDEIRDKVLWVHRHFPEIGGFIWVPEAEGKVQYLDEYAEKHGVADRSGIVLVDDSHADLIAAEEAGFGVWHVSSFLDWGEK